MTTDPKTLAERLQYFAQEWASYSDERGLASIAADDALKAIAELEAENKRISKMLNEIADDTWRLPSDD